MVINDEALIRESIATYLEDSGFRVIQAADGATGLEMVARHEPEVILLDLRMPEMDGLQVLSKVTTQWHETPVVVTGAGVLKDAIEALRHGAFDFISKPIIDLAILEHAVCRAVERRRLRRENRKHQTRLEIEVQSRIKDLQRRTSQLEQSNRKLESEMEEHRRTEEALRQSQSRRADVIAVFEGYIYAVDLNYRLSFMNSKLMTSTGCHTAEGLCHQVIYSKEAPCLWCLLDDVRKGLTVRREIQSSVDARWYYGIYSAQADAKGKVNGCQAIVMDIHERKQAEEPLHMQAHKLQAHNLRLRHSLQGAVRFGAMHMVYESILKAAESSANVIVYGESGTGKELVARTIHDLSDRGDMAFIPVNCGAIPDNLFESEFFGFGPTTSSMWPGTYSPPAVWKRCWQIIPMWLSVPFLVLMTSSKGRCRWAFWSSMPVLSVPMMRLLKRWSSWCANALDRWLPLRQPRWLRFCPKLVQAKFSGVPFKKLLITKHGRCRPPSMIR